MKRLLLLLTPMLALLSCTSPGEETAPEVGRIAWRTDHDEALAESRRTGKPVFLLFQEVPGCHACQVFGSEVLSHPLLVEAIESDFVPLLVRNNKPGKEAVLLERYREPSWNFPVVRFLSPEGVDLIERRDRIFTIAEMLPRMERALAKAQRKSAILPLVQPETVSPKLVALSQHCFWTGELNLGGIEGVVKTEAGWLKGAEVTLVHYDESRIAEDTLVAEAKKRSCANEVFRGADLKGYRPARESDQKRQLQGTAFANLPGLTAYQRTKLNAFARTDRNRAKTFLSPRQAAALK